MVSFMPQPLYLWIKHTPVPTAIEAVWTPELDWTLWRSDKSPVPAGNLNTFP